MSTDVLNKKPGSLKAWLDFLEALDPNNIELGLSRIKKVYDELGFSSFTSIPVIEVAGTNGKGSTAALIAASLNLSGIKTGLYTSPHLHKFNERVNIDGHDVSDDELVQGFDKVFDAAKKINVRLTYFEYTTLAALVCFANAKVKALVLEVGLGGRLDAVNVVDATIAVITSIGLDHTHILGDTIEKIAFEKAGIIKSRADVVVGKVDPKAKAVIYKAAMSHNCNFYAQDDHFAGFLNINGYNYVQKSSINVESYNYQSPKIPFICVPAALRVLTLLKAKGLNITHSAVNEAMRTVALPGRMQRVSVNPLIYEDVAHNPPAALHLVSTLGQKVKVGKRYAVLGMLKDKDIESVIKILSKAFDKFFITTLHTQRGENVARLEKALLDNNVDKQKIKSFEYVKDALSSAIKEADRLDEIIVLGSFVTVTEADEYLKSLKNNS